ncbi:hypothetical protein H4I95_10146 [Botrytis cinerea]
MGRDHRGRGEGGGNALSMKRGAGKRTGTATDAIEDCGGAREGKSEYKDFNEKIREEMGGSSGESDDGEEMEGSRNLAKRECPVPKPGGVLGGILGFKSSVGENASKPP